MITFKSMDSAPKDRWVLLLLREPPIPKVVCGGYFPDVGMTSGGTWAYPERDRTPSDGFLVACVPLGWAPAEFKAPKEKRASPEQASPTNLKNGDEKED